MPRALSLWGLNAPADVGDSALANVAMLAVHEEIGRSIMPYHLPPDSPNLRMLRAVVNERQRQVYRAPDVRGETTSLVGISAVRRRLRPSRDDDARQPRQ